MAFGVFLDGTDVTGVALKGSVTRRLNRPALSQVTLPMDAAIGGPGSRLKITPDPDWSTGDPVFFHGFVMNCETDTGEDTGYTVYNAADPMEMWQWRPARDPDGDFTKPTFIEDNITGPQIMEAILTASENPGLIPTAAEGPLFLDLGSFDSGGVSLTGAPVDWPMTIMEIANLLVSTGELDIVITPDDPGGGIMGEVDCFNGDYGNDRTASVIFEYATGQNNVRRLRWNEDMSNVCNKLWYFGGPRIATARDPAGEQHWCWNITGDDCCFTGVDGPFCTCISPDAAEMEAAFAVVDACRGDTLLDTGSQAAVGVRMDIKVWDALGERCLGPGAVDPGRDLYRWLWLTESFLRCKPRELIHITPIRGNTLTSAFDIGDLITVSAGASVRGGFTGAQRIYEYTIAWEEDGPFEISELQTSPNNEGL